MKNRKKRIMVDMSATLIHHGHIRILKAAKKLGIVVLALTKDSEILAKKGYVPELNFKERREICMAIKYVDEVIPCPWLIDEDFLDRNNIDLLVHGSDNQNLINPKRILVLPRTKGISSTLLRIRVLRTVSRVVASRSGSI